MYGGAVRRVNHGEEDLDRPMPVVEAIGLDPNRPAPFQLPTLANRGDVAARLAALDAMQTDEDYEVATRRAGQAQPAADAVDLPPSAAAAVDPAPWATDAVDPPPWATDAVDPPPWETDAVDPAPTLAFGTDQAPTAATTRAAGPVAIGRATVIPRAPFADRPLEHSDASDQGHPEPSLGVTGVDDQSVADVGLEPPVTVRAAAAVPPHARLSSPVSLG